VTAQPTEPLPDAVLRRVRGHHAFEACVEQLATAIRLGVYPTGSTLPAERDLATRLGVSRATLREAMAALRQAGLVETTRGRTGGTVVTRRGRGTFARRTASITPEQRNDWLDALEFRRVVEPAAAALAARADLDDDQRASLQTAHDAVAKAKGAGGHRQADSRFHLTVATLSGSPRTIEAVTSVQSSLHEMLLSIPFLGANINHSHRQHRDLTLAIQRGRSERARQVMEEHCDDTAALLRGFLG
jgi:GntR family transcriptional repressor for pyruvate dehydrogenase complex